MQSLVTFPATLGWLMADRRRRVAEPATRSGQHGVQGFVKAVSGEQEHRQTT